MNKFEITSKLSTKKANENNLIDLDAYETGLNDMFDYLKEQSPKTKQLDISDELLKFLQTVSTEQFEGDSSEHIVHDYISIHAHLK